MGLTGPTEKPGLLTRARRSVVDHSLGMGEAPGSNPGESTSIPLPFYTGSRDSYTPVLPPDPGIIPSLQFWIRFVTKQTICRLAVFSGIIGGEPRVEIISPPIMRHCLVEGLRNEQVVVSGGHDTRSPAQGTLRRGESRQLGE